MEIVEGVAHFKEHCFSWDFTYSCLEFMRYGSFIILLLAIFAGRLVSAHGEVPGERVELRQQAECGHHPCCETFCADVSHENGAPGEHHHHPHQCGVCCMVLPLFSEGGFGNLLVSPVSVWLRLKADSELLPDGPYLALEKPPLI